MSNDDKYGIGAGLMALGLAAGLILLGQFLPANMLTFLPHRDRNTAEAIFDATHLRSWPCPPAFSSLSRPSFRGRAEQAQGESEEEGKLRKKLGK